MSNLPDLTVFLDPDDPIHESMAAREAIRRRVSEIRRSINAWDIPPMPRSFR